MIDKIPNQEYPQSKSSQNRAQEQTKLDSKTESLPESQSNLQSESKTRFEIDQPINMTTYSHSRISTFETCKLQFKYHYIDKIKTEQEDTVETFLGSLVHEALEKLYKDLRFEKHLTLQELLDWFNTEWRRRWNPKTIKIVRKEYEEENYRSMGERYLTDYYDRYRPFDQTKTIGLETTDLLQLDENHKYHIRIDRFAYAGDGVYEIHDYKTNNTLKKQEELKQDRQLAMYAYWVQKSYPDAKRVKLMWHFLAFDKELVVEKNLEDLEQLKREVISEIKEIESCTNFPPTKSALCNWCAYQEICPLWKHKFFIETLSPEEFKREDGVKFVDKYTRLKMEESDIKKRLDELQRRLYLYAKQEGLEVIYGSTEKLRVWKKRCVTLPKKNDPEMAMLKRLLNEKDLYSKFSVVDSWNLAKAIENGLSIEGFTPKWGIVKRLYPSKR